MQMEHLILKSLQILRVQYPALVKRSRKLTIPDSLDDTTAENIAQGILNRYAQPLDQIKVKDIIFTQKIDFGTYRINNKPDEYSYLFSEMEILSDWTQSGTTFTESTTFYYTGRRSFLADISSGDAGDYVERTP